MRKIYFSLLCVFFFLPTGVMAQDYPYADDSLGDLPVETPIDGDPAAVARRQAQRPRALFRMGLKGGGNFTSFQDRVCQSANTSGCTSYLDRSFNGLGFEGRIGFGWDLAYQPIYIETEFAYLHKMMNIDNPLRVVQVQQGFFHRQRTGKDSMWKNGLLAAFDTRIATGPDGDLSYAIYPSIGFSTLAEWGAFMLQLNIYLSQIRESRNHWSTSFLTGIRF